MGGVSVECSIESSKITLPMVYIRSYHTPVLLPKVIEFLNVTKGKKYIDATIGGGGYTFEILSRGGVVLGIDVDKEAIFYTSKIIKTKRTEFKLNKDLLLKIGNFSNIKCIAEKSGFANVNGIIYDLGISSYQLDLSKKGFSYRGDEYLDMRADENLRRSAADILNIYSKEELYEIFTKYSEELNSRAISQAIVRARTIRHPITTTQQLVEIVSSAVGKDKKKHLFKVLSRIFQALRIEVNNELSNLKISIDQAIELLGVRGRIVIISYHSIEDRIVKTKFNSFSKMGIIEIITKRPIKPDQWEIDRNKRARSAKLRVAEKLL